MYSKQSFLTSIDREYKIINHLFAQLDESHFDYQPTEGQRTTRELLQYLSFIGAAQTKVIISGEMSAFEDGRKRAADLEIIDFPATMKAQREEIHKLISEVDAEELAAETEFMGQSAPRIDFLINLTLKILTAYRMQLFLYAKSAGLSELNTRDVWQGE